MANPKVEKLKTPDECETFARNAEERSHPELAEEARRKAFELRAAQHAVQTDVERAALMAVYCLEDVRSQGASRRWRANRTWQSIRKNGVLATVEYCVNHPREDDGHSILAKAGRADLSFEAVVRRYPDKFSSQLVEKARLRLASDQSQ